MLFILSGRSQIGKTRWLSSLVDDLRTIDVNVYGLLTPGVWVRRDEPGADAPTDPHSASQYEKLGIDGLFLPCGKSISFARRRDLAVSEGSYDGSSQSSSANLAWDISEIALSAINDYLKQVGEQSMDPGEERDGLLVIDEIGPLELLRNGGLVEGVRLLRKGPTPRYSHAIVVVRESLLPEARRMFFDAWGSFEVIFPQEHVRESVLALFDATR